MPPRRRRLPTLGAALCLALGLLGCDTSTHFVPDRLALADRQIAPAHREQVAAVLAEVFGEPDTPRVPETLLEVVDAEHVALAAGPVISHEVGVTHGLYRRHCARCHGVTGDGRGPTAAYQSPLPRDFRRGVFKFKSTERGAAPTGDDLHAVLHRGVAGTAMPSFQLLPDEEIAALVSYVKFLAARGAVERAVLEFVAEELDYDPANDDPATGDVAEGSELAADDSQTLAVVEEALRGFAERWAEAPDRVVAAVPPADPDSAARVAAGEKLFHDAARANCAKCHGAGGQGGVALQDFDDWTKRRREFVDATGRRTASAATLAERLAEAKGGARDQLAARLAEARREIAERRAVEADSLPIRPALPRRLAGGVLHGGGEPEQLFRVLHEGIAGSPMPGVGAALSDDEIWSLVAYVRSLLDREAVEPLAAGEVANR